MLIREIYTLNCNMSIPYFSDTYFFDRFPYFSDGKHVPKELNIERRFCTGYLGITAFFFHREKVGTFY